MTATQSHRFDIVVFGATSFAGQLLCRYLADRYPPTGEVSWCVAGRSDARLAALCNELELPELHRILVDATDEPGLHRMCEQAQVVVSTVGPYALYGSPLVAACVATGTDYCDLTGEVQWIRAMLDEHESAAARSGARIVHCCGFDSIPSDLGVWLVQATARERLGQPCERVRMRVKALRGGMSGGSAASMLNIMRQLRSDPALRRALSDPYVLCSAADRPSVRQPSVKFAAYDEVAQSWIAPFIMAAVNTRVVHRSNALSDYAYGDEFRYDEAMMTKRGVTGYGKAVALAGGLGAFGAAAAIPPTRSLLERFVLPKPGEGPSPEQQRRGFFDIRLYGTTGGGQQVNVTVTGDRDPGYGSTAKMLGEAAVCLVHVDQATRGGGFWTPATMFGRTLIDRLGANAGVRFETD